MRISKNLKNILFVVVFVILFSTVLTLISTVSNKEISAQSKGKKSVYELGISPSLEGISLKDDSDTVKAKLDSKHIYGRYIERTNHTTFTDPYLIYSQRFYTQYYNDFVPATLCDGKEYLIKFNDLNINNISYQMYRESSGKYYVVYNKLFGLSMKNEETIRRLNPKLDRKKGISIDFYDNKVCSITANYSENLDEIKELVDEYSFVYGEPKETSRDGKTMMRWTDINSTITISASKEVIEHLSHVDLYRGEKAFDKNKITLKIYDSSTKRNIVRYKSEIYMDIVRNLSYDYKNKVDSMNHYICEVKR